jgi:U3 small nucleolar RNA-associated protein MPP10
LQPGLGLNNPYEKRKMREELSAARSRGKVTVGEIDTDKDFKTSGKFFKRMQEEVEREVQGGDESSQNKKRRTEENGQKSSSFKL